MKAYMLVKPQGEEPFTAHWPSDVPLPSPGSMIQVDYGGWSVLHVVKNHEFIFSGNGTTVMIHLWGHEESLSVLRAADYAINLVHEIMTLDVKWDHPDRIKALAHATFDGMTAVDNEWGWLVRD